MFENELSEQEEFETCYDCFSDPADLNGCLPEKKNSPDISPCPDIACRQRRSGAAAHGGERGFDRRWWWNTIEPCSDITILDGAQEPDSEITHGSVRTDMTR